MCQVCGCAITSPGEPVVLEILQDLLAANDRTAAHNRAHFDEHATVGNRGAATEKRSVG